jgi:hypothetical protein
MQAFLTAKDEQRLRELANGIVRGIQTPEEVLARLDFTHDDYTELSDTRAFRQMLREAQDEWEGARNTHKRIKLKAAVNIEEALPHFYTAMTSDKEPLSSKVKAFEVVARVAGLGNPEPVGAGAGQFFKLEINLGGGVAPMVLESGVQDVTIDHDSEEAAGSLRQAVGHYSQSKVFDDLPLEDL